MSPTPKKRKRGQPRPPAADPIESEFGPAPVEETAPPEPPRASGPIPGLACAGEGCLLKPVADLFGRFALGLGRGHGVSLSRAAFSGIELMKALRDFLDEEIAFAERAAGKRGPGQARYSRIPVE